ncbi:hypothetical protein EBU24_02570 [bacterium]|nr:hypothetical protein [bacterium]
MGWFNIGFECNGWSNRATWLINLHIDQYADIDALVKDFIYDDNTSSVRRLASFLENLFEDELPNMNGLFKELLMVAFREVDWHELAETYINNELSRLDALKMAGVENE